MFFLIGKKNLLIIEKITTINLIFADIDGRVDMRLIYGIIAVEERGKRVKEGKVCLLVSTCITK